MTTDEDAYIDVERDQLAAAVEGLGGPPAGEQALGERALVGRDRPRAHREDSASHPPRRASSMRVRTRRLLLVLRDEHGAEASRLAARLDRVVVRPAARPGVVPVARTARRSRRRRRSADRCRRRGRARRRRRKRRWACGGSVPGRRFADRPLRVTLAARRGSTTPRVWRQARASAPGIGRATARSSAHRTAAALFGATSPSCRHRPQ